MAEWKWPRGNWWKPKPNWWTRSAHYHALSDAAKTILTGAWDLAEGDLVVPADPQMLATASGLDARPVRVARHVATIIERGFAVGVGDGLMRLVHEYSEHCRLAPARTKSVPRAYQERTVGVPPAVPRYATGTAEPPISDELNATNKNSTIENYPPSEGSARGFALAPPPVEPAAPKRKKAKKEPPPPPEPVVVPEHMKALERYQLENLERTKAHPRQTVDEVIRWGMEMEKLYGFPIRWDDFTKATMGWLKSSNNHRPKTTGFLGGWLQRDAEKDPNKWRVGYEPQVNVPVNGTRKGFGVNGAPVNPDGSFNPNHAYNPVPPKVYVSPTADWTQEDHDDYAKNMNF